MSKKPKQRMSEERKQEIAEKENKLLQDTLNKITAVEVNTVHLHSNMVEVLAESVACYKKCGLFLDNDFPLVMSALALVREVLGNVQQEKETG